MSSILAQKLRLLRTDAGYTQKKVADYLNIERQTYCNYENELRIPSLDVVVKLADLYKVSVDYLVKDNAAYPKQWPPATSAEIKLLEHFRTLSPQNQKETFHFICLIHKTSSH